MQPGPRRPRWPRPCASLMLLAAGCVVRPPAAPPTSMRAATAPAAEPAAPPAASELRGHVPASSAELPWVVFVRSGQLASGTALPAVVWRRAEGAFTPTLLVVSAGQPIELVNDEDLCHRFFSAPAFSAFDLGLLRPGDSGTFRICEPGPVPIYCALHGGRQATLLVVPNPCFTRAAPSGEFALSGVLPGPCVLEAWREGTPPVRLVLDVPEGGLRDLELVVPAAEPGR